MQPPGILRRPQNADLHLPQPLKWFLSECYRGFRSQGDILNAVGKFLPSIHIIGRLLKARQQLAQFSFTRRPLTQRRCCSCITYLSVLPTLFLTVTSKTLASYEIYVGFNSECTTLI
ncbi:uncharacterized protein ZBAI_04806 [Zygosaccharomyces bailii ISA1307]|nr:uncharacterized protein ZBAI_04806 [Zygosaccharomyces bailii ISA1307]